MSVMKFESTNFAPYFSYAAHGLNETFKFCMVKRKTIPCHKIIKPSERLFDAGT